MAKDKPPGHQLWFEGHWGFQYYMEKFGGRRIDIERSSLQPGDVVAVPWFNSGYVQLPLYSAGWLETFEFWPYAWMNLFGTADNKAAGFYSADFGPVPFVIGKLPPQDYFVAKIFSRAQFKTQPVNREEVEAGGVPDFSKLAISAERQTALQTALADDFKQAEAGVRLEEEGKAAEAVQAYRQALRTDPDNPVVLNNLAWILATASRPELRNGEEAVQLATRAAELTDYREPHCIGTLAAAYARVGRFPEAVELTTGASILAQMTSQPEEAAKNAKLLRLYGAGKTLDTSDGP
jgi:tetratricopeptide (TPR) repeat protein